MHFDKTIIDIWQPLELHDAGLAWFYKPFPHLKDGEATTQPFSGQQVPFPGYHCLLKEKEKPEIKITWIFSLHTTTSTLSFAPLLDNQMAFLGTVVLLVLLMFDAKII